MTKTDHYQEDLAYIHDVGFNFHARGAAQALLQIFRRHGITQGLVVDLGCGSGIWAAELVSAGYNVLGVDQSESMIRLARKKAPRAKFIRLSYLDVPLPACEAVTNYLPALMKHCGPEAYSCLILPSRDRSMVKIARATLQDQTGPFSGKLKKIHNE